MFPQPKPARQALLKPREDYRYAKARLQVIRAAYARDGWRCRCCRHDGNLHPHEIRYRSRGGDPLDVHNVLTLCNLCHLAGVHGKRLHLAGSDANGTIRFSGSWLDYITQFRSKAGKR